MDRSALIEQYRQGPDRIAGAVRGLSAAELDYTPSDGGWSAREVVHHTADSELTSAIRLRRLLAEDHPQIIGYDGDEFARKLYYRRAAGPAFARRHPWRSRDLGFTARPSARGGLEASRDA